MQTHYVHCKAGSYYRARTTVQRGSMQLKWKTLNPTCRVTEFMCRLWCVCVCAYVCVFKIKVFVNPVLDSDDGELLISASILIRPRFLAAAL